jgi:hypothetical protein
VNSYRPIVFLLCLCGVLLVGQPAGSATPLAPRFQVTPDGTAYNYSYSNGTVTVTAPSTSGANDRELFWASTAATESNTTACATFSGGQDLDQPGIAMRIADDGNQAVTVTENIFSSGGSPRNQFNFDTWNTANDPAFTEFGTATVSGLPSSPATWPLNMCAQITGDLVQFVVWTSGTQPAWGDPTWGGQATLPSDAPLPFSGQTGFFVGHLTPGTSLEYSNLTVDGQPNNPTPSRGYWLVGSDGGIFSFGSAQFYGSTGSLVLQRPVVGIVPTSDHGGYWLDASDGGVFSFGDTQFYGSIPGIGLTPAGSGLPNALNAPIVGMVPTADDGGYFMVASDGGVFAFGDAKFEGSCPGIGGCSGSGVAVMPDATGDGYWLVTATGDVYPFGDAPNYGEPGSRGVPVTSAVRTPDGGGYWVLFANGAVATYGDAGNYGSAIGAFGGLNPATAIFTTSDGGGYWIASANGTVDQFGDAPNDGGMSGTHLNGSIIAATGF